MRVLLALFLSGSLVFAQKAPKPLREINAAFQQWARTLSPAVVLIRAQTLEPVAGEAGVSAPISGTGSGVLLSADGHIVTNAHVVGRNAVVDVHLPPPPPLPGSSAVPPRTRKLEGRVLGLDRETDLAVVKIEGKDLPFLKLGDSDEVAQGQLVMAIGNPLGLENSVTLGVISAVARQLQTDARVVYLQTDAPINPGNSGGALIDIDGNLIGINTMIASQSGGSEGLGFAVPSRIVQTVYEQIRAQGRVTRGDIGVTAQTITSALAAGLGLQREYGVLLADVQPKGPADAAGLKVGDIVLAMDGKPMENARQFHVNLYRKPIASLAALEVLRGTERTKIDVIVVDRFEKSFQLTPLSSPRDHFFRRLHILGYALDEKIRAQLPPTRFTYGILVLGLLPGLSAASQPLEPGDILYKINDKPVSTLTDLRDLLGAFKPGDVAILQIEREGKLRFLEFALE